MEDISSLQNKLKGDEKLRNAIKEAEESMEQSNYMLEVPGVDRK